MSLNRFSQIFRQSAVRQSLALMVVFAAITTLSWLGTSWFVQRDLERLATQRLIALASGASEALRNETDLPPPLAGQALAVVQNGQIVTGQLPFDLPRGALAPGLHYADARKEFSVDYLYYVVQRRDGYVIAAEYYERQEELLDVMNVGLQLSLWISLFATGAAGIWLGRRAQARINVIGSGLAQVAQGDLSTRITLTGGQDDLKALATLINTTTERLETLVGQLRVQSSNIAHDLRTPLARLRAGLERALIDADNHNTPIAPDTLDHALTQVDHIVGTFDALLRLAKIENTARQEGFTEINLGTLAEQLVTVFGPVIEDSGHRVTLTLRDPQTLRADADLLLQLGANLIQNALRYGAEGQTIAIAVQGRQFTISDQGPGIPVDERKKVLDPLYRLSDTRQSEGFGLGLSLVRAICDLHEADLTLSDAPDGRGLRVSVRFPQTDPQITKL